MATFKESFASAKKAGKKEFKWNGKSYNTQTRSDSAPTSSPRPKARPAAKPAGKPTESWSAASSPREKKPRARGTGRTRNFTARQTIENRNKKK